MNSKTIAQWHQDSKRGRPRSQNGPDTQSQQKGLDHRTDRGFSLFKKHNTRGLKILNLGKGDNQWCRIQGGARLAPARRAEHEIRQKQLEYFSEANIARHLLDAVPNILRIRNATRQIVSSNQALIDLVGVAEAAPLCGLPRGNRRSGVTAGGNPG